MKNKQNSIKLINRVVYLILFVFILSFSIISNLNNYKTHCKQVSLKENTENKVNSYNYKSIIITDYNLFCEISEESENNIKFNKCKITFIKYLIKTSIFKKFYKESFLLSNIIKYIFIRNFRI